MPHPWQAKAIAARWEGRRATAENFADRFWALVDRRDAGDCWPWLGGRCGGKAALYGIFRKPDGKRTTTHRIAYELSVGEIPYGFELDHLCNNPTCCNPLHLEPVTQAENRRRQAERQTHCRRGGHPLSGDNLFLKPDGSRGCRICRREREGVSQRARRASRRAASSTA